MLDTVTTSGKHLLLMSLLRQVHRAANSSLPTSSFEAKRLCLGCSVKRAGFPVGGLRSENTAAGKEQNK